MWYLEKVVIICLAQLVLIPRMHTKPHTFISNNQAKGNNKYSRKNYLSSAQTATDFKNSDTNRESILKSFNFRDIEYPIASSTPKQFYFGDFNDNQPPKNFMSEASIKKRSSDIKPARNVTFRNLQKFVKPAVKSNASKPKSVSIPPTAFPSDSDFRRAGNFPEVEYPLSAKETWKPNYWSIPSDFNDFNTFLDEDLQFNQKLTNILPIKHLGINDKSGKYNSFSIKSYSDMTKNKERLKEIIKDKANNATKATNKQTNSTRRNDFIVNIKTNLATNDFKTLPTEKKVQELHITTLPYFTTIDKVPDCEELQIDLLNSKIFLNCNKGNENSTNYIPTQNDLLSKIMDPQNQLTNNNTLKIIQKSVILPKHNTSDEEDVSSKNIQGIQYDLYDILDIRKSEAGSDLCGLDEDYTTDIYPEENNIEWFSQPVTTPPPFNATAVDLTWKNCKIITPCEFYVDELEDYYISV